MTLYVVDASHYQAGLPVGSLAAQGFSAGIFKATEGISYVDASFGAFIQEARAATLPCAAYHYLHPTGMPAQAALTARVVPADIPVWVDVEGAATLDQAYAYADALRALGRRIGGIYSGSRPAPGYGGWWRAAYLTDPTGYASTTYAALGGDTGSPWSSGCDLWQFCQHGRLASYSGDVDFSAFRGTTQQLLARGWFWTPAAPTPDPTIPEDSMFAQSTHASSDGTISSGDIFQLDAAGRRKIPDLATWRVLQAANPAFVQLTGDQIAAGWPPAGTAVATVDEAALAVQLETDLAQHLAGGVDAAALAATLAANLAARLAQ